MLATMPHTALNDKLATKCFTWLVTGAAGFIGSNLVEALLRLDQTVTGLDNFATGSRYNIDEIKASVTPEQWGRFTFVEGDICNLADCHMAAQSVDYILHQAALGSVPRSLIDPITTNDVNIGGFLNMLVAARDAGVKRFVYAASSSTYGDSAELPKVEDRIGKPLSPYGLTKYVNELYADIFARSYGLDSIGLRYFNVFGRRQDPNGAYAAVIPKWIGQLIKGEAVAINGDGETSRDFCYIDNVVQINLLAALGDNPGAANQVYNVAIGGQTTLNQLYQSIVEKLRAAIPQLVVVAPNYLPFRYGDIRHSRASIGKAQNLLGYAPTDDVQQGLEKAMSWYIAFFKHNQPARKAG